MNISLERTDAKAVQVHTNVDKDTTVYRNRQTIQAVEESGYALDISGTVMDNNAYAGHGRTTEEVMQKAGQENIIARRNYMAVMSNSMSDEDFSRLQREGFHPGSTDIETVVTIVDHIKAALMKGGTNVIGYTDTVSNEVLTNITGSETFARELENQFQQMDIPMTQENIDAVMEGWDILNKITDFSDSSTKYMIENEMTVSSENLYKAHFSVAENVRQRKSETIDFQSLLPQVQKIIEAAGYQVNEENLAAAQWMLEAGLALNTENFIQLKTISGLKLPVSDKDYAQVAVSAIADGQNPVQASLLKKESYLQQAVKWVEAVQKLTEEATDLIQIRELPLTLRNICIAQESLDTAKSKENYQQEGNENIHGRRLLQEIRLSMTVEANLRLLRSGYQIDTAPLEELISQLKKAEGNYQKVLTGEENALLAEEKASLYQQTLHTLTGIKVAPAAALAQIKETNTLQEVWQVGNSRRLAYERAGESYESIMTAPRSDMGDSIRKAFRNVDDILEAMKLEITEENRKAVRILGYNKLEITQENIAQIKSREKLLTEVVSQLKPGRVLHMIREGENPVTMPLNELEQYLSNQTDIAGEMESYSKFLYKLEKNKDITQLERDAYIGVYRLVRQLEKREDAAVGALWQTGAEFTLENLLTVNRSSRRKQMDYQVDDSFGGVHTKESGTKSITQQLADAFDKNAEPQREKLEQLLKDVESEQADAEFDKIVFEEVRTAVKSEEAIQQYLTDYRMPITADYLMAVTNMTKNPQQIWKEIVSQGTPEKADITSSQAQEEATEQNILDILTQAGEKVIAAFDQKENAGKAYEDMQGMVQDILEKTAYTEEVNSLDVRAMSNLYKQLSFMGAMAKEENYEIPISIDGQITSVNLKIVHSEKEESKVAIGFEAQTLGKLTAEFRIVSGKLNGFCMSESQEEVQLLKSNRNAFYERLQKEDIQIGDIFFAIDKKMDLEEFSIKQSTGRQTKGEAGVLYKAARAFIGFTQEISVRKGSGIYEN